MRLEIKTNQDQLSVPLLTVMRSSIILKNWKVTWNKLRNTDNKWGKDSRKRKVEKINYSSGLPPVVGGSKKILPFWPSSRKKQNGRTQEVKKDVEENTAIRHMQNVHRSYCTRFQTVDKNETQKLTQTRNNRYDIRRRHRVTIFLNYFTDKNYKIYF